MKPATRKILSGVEIAPALRRKTRALQISIQKQMDALDGKPVPDKLRQQFKVFTDANLAYLRLFRLLCSISDPNVRALLMARAEFNMPWTLLQFPGGSNALAGVIAWLDEHGHELVFKNKEG